MGYFVVANYIERFTGKLVEFVGHRVRACLRVCGCVGVSNRQDVCRAECSGDIAKEPNKFEPHSEVNVL